MEAEICHDILALCKPGNPKHTCGIIQFKSEGLRTRGTNSITPSVRLKAQEFSGRWGWEGAAAVRPEVQRSGNLQCLKVREDGQTSSRREGERIYPSFTFLFFSNLQQIG